MSIKDLQNIVPSQINNQATRIPQASSYSVNDPKLVEQLSQLHAQASGQQVDLVHAIHSSMPSSQPPANFANPQSDVRYRCPFSPIVSERTILSRSDVSLALFLQMSLFKHVLGKIYT